MSSTPVAVLGAGAGGLAIAADLTLAGRDVRLLELPEFSEIIDAIDVNGGIDRSDPHGSQKVRPRLVTTAASDALKGVELIQVAVPAFAHKRAIEFIEPYLAPGQVLLFNTGYWAALRFGRRLARLRVLVAESALLIYAVRKTAPAAIWVDGVKGEYPLAAFPASETDRLIDLVRGEYAQVRGMRNVLEVSLENLNPLFHPAIALLNLGEIQRSTEFAFYSAGCTEAVGRVIDGLDAERLALGRMLGLPDLLPGPEWLRRYYGAEGKDSFTAIHACIPYRDFRWPPKTAFRYVHEDAPFALVPFVRFGEILGVPTPTAKALVELCGQALHHDYWSEGPTTSDLGIAGMTAAQIRRLVL